MKNIGIVSTNILYWDLISNLLFNDWVGVNR